jgi:hypothetical protein
MENLQSKPNTIQTEWRTPIWTKRPDSGDLREIQVNPSQSTLNHSSCVATEVRR